MIDYEISLVLYLISPQFNGYINHSDYKPQCVGSCLLRFVEVKSVCKNEGDWLWSFWKRPSIRRYIGVKNWTQ